MRPLRVGLGLALVGLAAFGGPAAHVALMRRAVVERRRWIEQAEFNRMFAACNLIPGPSSTELAMFLGYRLAGWPGLATAAVCFITPALAIMLALAYLYDRYAAAPLARDLFYGVRPVVVGIVAWAALDLLRHLVKQRALLVAVPAAFALYVAGVNPVAILALAGVAGAFVAAARRTPTATTLVAALAPHPERLVPLFLTFLKIGVISFGSGYVLFAFLNTDFVAGLHWLRPAQLVDAVALSQVTPGPVFTVATFLGFLFAGVPGALLASLAIFLPGLALVPLLDRLVRWTETSRAVRLLLEVVNAAVIGLVLGVAFELARTAVVDAVTAAFALAAFAVVWWRPLAAPAAVALGAAVGYLHLALIR
ncbi:MAG TPA: chromate efflux transporter [Candidatus Dormibacteraeota bacterium]